ncbi:MAG TPA: hypothetical protein PKO28_00650 [Bacilli bacterium]|nr:hypothetical protein [Bacilli bacterium]HPS18730.1 hypothetical protein [Bacilli bacterium]
MKNKFALLFLSILLTGCHSYQGPYFYVAYDANPRYILWETVSEMSETVDSASNLIFVLGVSNCSHCIELKETLPDYLTGKKFSIYHIDYDASIKTAEDYGVLLNITNGGEEQFLPAYQENFYVPKMFVIENKVAVYLIDKNFTQTLDDCIKVNC